MVDRPLISVRELVVEFRADTGTVRALDSVSLDLHPGRVLGVVGESGCGKSVTARAILRILDRNGSITAGQILLDPGTTAETDITALDPESQRMRAVRGARVGLIFQRHPYTRALLRSVPDLRATPRQRLATIGGAVPQSNARPSGCPFHPRCPEIIAGRCDILVPRPVPPGAAGASCFRLEDAARTCWRSPACRNTILSTPASCGGKSPAYAPPTT